MLPLVLALAVGGSVAFTFQDPRISESSGLAAASTGDVLFTHNDSGDNARFFAVGPDGRTLVTYDLPDVQARDWEDLARGPDEQGRSSLWLGDIGDNNARRDNGILVHRVREPVPGDDDEVTTEEPTSFRLRYPDGPGDAEGLAVHPRTGRLHVVSKPLAGPAQVYAAPAVLDPDGPNLLERVGEVRTRATGTPGGPGIGGLAQRLVTAADFSPDGTRFAVRTYTDVYEYALDGDDLGPALDGEPVVTALPPTRQGEGLTYARDGAALLTSSEDAGAPVHRVVPVAPGQPASPLAASPPPARGAAEAGPERLVLAGAVAAVLLVVVLLLSGRRRP